MCRNAPSPSIPVPPSITSQHRESRSLSLLLRHLHPPYRPHILTASHHHVFVHAADCIMNGASSTKRSKAPTPRLGGSDTTRRGLNKRTRHKLTIQYPSTIRKMRITFEQIDEDDDVPDAEDETERPTGRNAITHERPFHDAQERSSLGKCHSEESEALSARRAVVPRSAGVERHQMCFHPSWTALGTSSSQEVMPELLHTLSTPQSVPWFRAHETKITKMEPETLDEQGSKQKLEESAITLGDDGIYR